LQCNLDLLRGSVRRRHHLRNLDPRQQLINNDDVTGLRRVPIGFDTDVLKLCTPRITTSPANRTTSDGLAQSHEVAAALVVSPATSAPGRTGRWFGSGTP
jgi:hypothetical protein